MLIQGLEYTSKITLMNLLCLYPTVRDVGPAKINLRVAGS